MLRSRGSWMFTLQAWILWLHSPNLQHTRRSKIKIKIVRSQRKKLCMRQHKLWAAGNKPAAERKRGKILSKIKKFSLEGDNIEPRNIQHQRFGTRLPWLVLCCTSHIDPKIWTLVSWDFPSGRKSPFSDASSVPQKAALCKLTHPYPRRAGMSSRKEGPAASRPKTHLYWGCKVSFRHDGQLVHAAFVVEDGVVEWAAPLARKSPFPDATRIQCSRAVLHQGNLACKRMMHATSPSQVKPHVATKSVQSMKDGVRFQDCLSELDAGDHDLVFASETWRSDVHEVFETPRGGRLYLSGGAACRGVGISISPQCCAMISDICFHAISARLCMVHLTCHGR